MRVAQPLDQFVQFLALQRPVVHGEESGAAGLGQLDEILPAVWIFCRTLPHHALHLLGVHVCRKAFHAMTFDKGGHVIFERAEVVRHVEFVVRICILDPTRFASH